MIKTEPLPNDGYDHSALHDVAFEVGDTPVHLDDVEEGLYSAKVEEDIEWQRTRLKNAWIVTNEYLNSINLQKWGYLVEALSYSEEGKERIKEIQEKLDEDIINNVSNSILADFMIDISKLEELGSSEMINAFSERALKFIDKEELVGPLELLGDPESLSELDEDELKAFEIMLKNLDIVAAKRERVYNAMDSGLGVGEGDTKISYELLQRISDAVDKLSGKLPEEQIDQIIHASWHNPAAIEALANLPDGLLQASANEIIANDPHKEHEITPDKDDTIVTPQTPNIASHSNRVLNGAAL